MVKSRLAADLSPERAAFIYRVILENILQKLCTVNCEVALYCYPDSKHTFFVNCKDQYKVSLHKQRGCDLGMRMYASPCRDLAWARWSTHQKNRRACDSCFAATHLHTEQATSLRLLRP